MGRSPCCEKAGVKKGRWTAEEDETLIKYIQAHGEGSWRSLPKKAGLLRCGKSCRLRWINYLRSDLKRGNFTAKEEELIVKLHNVLGNRWSLIASHLPGRTDNEVKNYWNSHLRRKIYCFIKLKDDDDPHILSALENARQWKRKGDPTSRSPSFGNNDKSSSSNLKDLMKKPNKVGHQIEAPKQNPKAFVAAEEDLNGEWKDNGNRNRTAGGVSCMQNEGSSSSCCAESYNEGEKRPCKEGEERQELGPYEWLDNEIMRLSNILQNEDDQPSGKNEHRELRGVGGIYEGEGSGFMGVVGAEVGASDDHERESHSCSLYLGNEGLFTCSSSENSGFDDKCMDLDWDLGWFDAIGISHFNVNEREGMMFF